MDIKPIPDNFCWRPFTNLYVDKWGFRGPCCGFHQSEKFNENDLENLDLHKDIRDSIKNGRLPAGCTAKCTSLEEKGILVTDRLTYYGPTDDRLVEENRFELKQLELSVDNVCNLACVTCGSQHSSRWLAEHNRMGTKDLPDDIWGVVNYLDVNAFKKLSIWKNTEKLILYGGEPFYSKRSTDLINWLLENDLSQNIELSFYTNGTIIPDNINDIIKRFKKIRCSLSIDATEERFETIRWPAKWNEVDANFKKLKNINADNVRLDMTYTYSLLNASYSVEDFKYFKETFTDLIGLNIVTDPAHWRARNLPDGLKKKLIEKYKQDDYVKQFIPELLLDRNENEYQTALEKLKFLDTYRNTDYRILFDEE